MRPWVDAVVTTCNRPHLLARALEGVRSQTYLHKRCVVVSVDTHPATQMVLDSFSSSIDKVVHLPSATPAQARNVGAGCGQGELLAFCDDDNRWREAFLEVLVDEMRDTDVVAYSGQQCYLAGGAPESLRVLGRRIRSTPHNPAALLHANYIDTSCALLRRSAFDKAGGFDESLESLEDWDLFARISIEQPYSFRHVDEVLSEYWYYLTEVLTTITNSKEGDAGVLAAFDIKAPLPDEALVRERLRRQVHGLHPGR